MTQSNTNCEITNTDTIADNIKFNINNSSGNTGGNIRCNIKSKSILSANEEDISIGAPFSISYYNSFSPFEQSFFNQTSLKGYTFTCVGENAVNILNGYASQPVFVRDVPRGRWLFTYQIKLTCTDGGGLKYVRYGLSKTYQDPNTYGLLGVEYQTFNNLNVMTDIDAENTTTVSGNNDTAYSEAIPGSINSFFRGSTVSVATNFVQYFNGSCIVHIDNMYSYLYLKLAVGYGSGKYNAIGTLTGTRM
jgi:hypothetical protein